MQQIITNLKSFNRKERFHLIGTALGNKDFKLADEFRSILNTTFSINIPSNAFVAMDYHLDWIWASLYLNYNLDDKQNKVYPNTYGIITANQEDIDIIVAYIEGVICHIVMLEAKAETGWTNKQMQSKADRLTILFGKGGKKWNNVIPHFAIISPHKPIYLETDNWSDWMKPDGNVKWLELKLPESLRIIRCDENRKITENGMFWMVKHKKWQE
jgi:hypothetical protein